MADGMRLCKLIALSLITGTLACPLNKAVDKWVLGGAETPPKFLNFYVKDLAHSTQHTTAYDVK